MTDATGFGARMREHLDIVERDNAAALDQVAAWMLDAVAADGLIHVTGTGHSTALVLESFYRAGGLACVNPVTHAALNPLEGGQASTLAERRDDLAVVLIGQAAPTAGEVAFVFSNSGINPLPVALAAGFRDAGARVVAVSSRRQMAASPARAESKLDEVADVVLDTATPLGDAAFDAGHARTAAWSSLTSVYLWNLLLARLADLARTKAVELPLWTSANTPEGDERNAQLFATYRPRVRAL